MTAGLRGGATDPVRTLALFFEDWPITALALSAPTPPDPEEPVAVIHGGAVIACSASARREGVRVGRRRRDAQAACPSLRIVAADPDRDARTFGPIVKRIEALTPGVQPARPGLCLLRARGPARYYGGEREAAQVLLDMLGANGVPGVTAGIADGPFTAEHAARTGRSAVTVIHPGQSAQFLAPLPTTALEDDALADMLARLGVHTLGEFAALDAGRVHDRLSDRGARLHALASGADSRPVLPRTPPAELSREIAFEPPLELAEQVAFAVRTTADAVITALAAVSLVCTEVRVELTDDRGGHDERLWLHPTCFDASGIVDRVRWQLQAVWDDASPTLSGGVALVRIIPETVDAGANHQPGLFGQGTDARLHHALSRVQGMLGHRSVLTPAIGGGRRLHERQTLVPWGDRVVVPAERTRPWPGHLPAPLPATVFSKRRPVSLVDAAGAPVAVDERGSVTAPPAALAVSGRMREIRSWAGPWPLQERTWDAARATHAHRFQVVTEDEVAWLLLLDDEGWIAEGRYD